MKTLKETEISKRIINDWDTKEYISEVDYKTTLNINRTSRDEMRRNKMNLQQ